MRRWLKRNNGSWRIMKQFWVLFPSSWIQDSGVNLVCCGNRELKKRSRKDRRRWKKAGKEANSFLEFASAAELQRRKRAKKKKIDLGLIVAAEHSVQKGKGAEYIFFCKLIRSSCKKGTNSFLVFFYHHGSMLFLSFFLFVAMTFCFLVFIWV